MADLRRALERATPRFWFSDCQDDYRTYDHSTRVYLTPTGWHLSEHGRHADLGRLSLADLPDAVADQLDEWAAETRRDAEASASLTLPGVG